MFSLCNFIFQRLIWKELSVYFLRFHYWILKEWKAAKVENHSVSAYYLHKWLVHFFFCEIPRYVQTKKRLAHLDWDFMEMGYQAYRAGWGLWMQADSVPSDEKFSCKWHLSFFKAVPSNSLSFYLGGPLHIISSLLCHFCLLQNTILHKMLKLGFWNFKPIFLWFHWLQFFFSLV